MAFVKKQTATIEPWQWCGDAEDVLRDYLACRISLGRLNLGDGMYNTEKSFLRKAKVKLHQYAGEET